MQLYYVLDVVVLSDISDVKHEIIPWPWNVA